jgi:hypothetical protein
MKQQASPVLRAQSAGQQLTRRSSASGEAANDRAYYLMCARWVLNFMDLRIGGGRTARRHIRVCHPHQQPPPVIRFVCEECHFFLRYRVWQVSSQVVWPRHPCVIVCVRTLLVTSPTSLDGMVSRSATLSVRQLTLQVWRGMFRVQQRCSVSLTRPVCRRRTKFHRAGHK